MLTATGDHDHMDHSSLVSFNGLLVILITFLVAFTLILTIKKKKLVNTFPVR